MGLLSCGSAVKTMGVAVASHDISHLPIMSYTCIIIYLNLHVLTLNISVYTPTMSFYVNQCLSNVYLLYVCICICPMSHHQGSTNRHPYCALRSREELRTTSHHEASRKVNGRCWNYAPSVCSKCGEVDVRRTKAATAGTKNEMSLSGNKNIGPLILCSQKYILRPIRILQTTSL